MPSFFDTNILIYAVDEGEPDKFGIARALVEEHLVEGDGMISVQVLREFYTASRRLSRPLSDEQTQEMVRYLSTFRTLTEDAGMVLGAIRLSREYTLSFWDALIVEAALAGGADRLLIRPPARAGDRGAACRESLSLIRHGGEMRAQPEPGGPADPGAYRDP